MLVLSRKSGEAIRIGDEIIVTVLGTRGNVMRLGVEAPREVRVLRGELKRQERAAQPGRRLAAAIH